MVNGDSAALPLGISVFASIVEDHLVARAAVLFFFQRQQLLFI
jgi:hypothetical protein